MSRLKELREEANREPDPEVRRQRIAKLDEIEAGIRDADQRLAAVKANLADLQGGRKRFFSWTEFTIGLGVVAAFAGTVYFGPSFGTAMIVVAIVVLVIAGIIVRRRIKRTVKGLDESA